MGEIPEALSATALSDKKRSESALSTSGAPPGADLHPVIRVDGSRPLSAETVAAMNEFSTRVEGSSAPGVAVLEVSGAPDGYRAGDLDVQLVNKWEGALRRLERLAAATVAVVTGDCGGVALETMLATDVRIATDEVRLLLPTEHGLAWPGMALYRLVTQVGGARARRSVLLGAPIPVAEAVELHLVDEIVTDSAAAFGRAAELLADIDGTELAVRRRLLLDASCASFEDALGRHLAACERTLRRAPATAGATP